MKSIRQVVYVPCMTQPQLLSEQYVMVPARLAHRIRLALDHAHRDDHSLDESGETVNNRLATQLILCEGFPDCNARTLTLEALEAQQS